MSTVTTSAGALRKLLRVFFYLLEDQEIKKFENIFLRVPSKISKECCPLNNLSSLAALEAPFPRTPLISQIRDTILKIPSKHFYLTWVRGHSGVVGNERADALAGQATSRPDFSCTVPVPISFIKKQIKTEILSCWQESWTNSTKGRLTFSIFNTVDLQLKCNNETLIYFFTGHGSFPSYLFKIGKKDNPNCFCGAEGVPMHYITNTCQLMPNNIKLNSEIPLNSNFKIILSNKNLVRKIIENYNTLNNFYSNIQYKF